MLDIWRVLVFSWTVPGDRGFFPRPSKHPKCQKTLSNAMFLQYGIPKCPITLSTTMVLKICVKTLCFATKNKGFEREHVELHLRRGMGPSDEAC